MDLLYRLDPRKIHVESGDIPVGYWELHGCVMEKSHSMCCCKRVETNSEESKLNLDQAIAGIEVKDVTDAGTCTNLLGVGVGALIGLRFFGPLGAVAGAIAAQALGGGRHEVAVTVNLADGRHFEAKMDKNVYQRMKVIMGRSK